MKDQTQRHLKYKPHKVGGWASRKDEWLDINWENHDDAIAKFLDVSRQAVRGQRKRRGIPFVTLTPENREFQHRYRP